MRYTDRFEYKYVLDYRTYLAFNSQIKVFMSLDYHTRILPEKKYFVRSLYYDTYDFAHYKESEDGQFGRIKCRVRTYHPNAFDADVISIEIKTKHGSNVIKYSQLISKKQYETFLKNHRFDESLTVLDEFTRLIVQGQLEPQLIVEYEREGFIPKDGSDLRLTFDHHVRSKKAKKLFDDDIHTRNHRSAIVCEIKCGMNKPLWLEQLVKKYGLKMIRNSKYVQAVNLVYPGMIGFQD
jgi:hypothetical protein